MHPVRSAIKKRSAGYIRVVVYRELSWKELGLVRLFYGSAG
jgi:hypothetical protein